MISILLMLFFNISKSDVIYLEEEELLSLYYGIGSNYPLLRDIKELPNKVQMCNLLSIQNYTLNEYQQIIIAKSYSKQGRAELNLLVKVSDYNYEFNSYNITTYPFKYKQVGRQLNMDTNFNITLNRIQLKQSDDNYNFVYWDLLQTDDNIVYVIGYVLNFQTLVLQKIQNQQTQFYKQKNQSFQQIMSENLISKLRLVTIGDQICLLNRYSDLNYILSLITIQGDYFYLTTQFESKQYKNKDEIIKIKQFDNQYNELSLFGSGMHIVIFPRFSVKLTYLNTDCTQVYRLGREGTEYMSFNKTSFGYTTGLFELFVNQTNLSLLSFHQYLNQQYDIILYNSEYLYISGQEFYLNIDLISYLEDYSLLFITSGKIQQIYKITAQNSQYIQIKDQKVIKENLEIINIKQQNQRVQFNLTLMIPYNEKIKEKIIKLNLVPTTNIEFVKDNTSFIKDISQYKSIIDMKSIQNQYQYNWNKSKLIYFYDEHQYIWAMCSIDYIQQKSQLFIQLQGFQVVNSKIQVDDINCEKFNELKFYYQIEDSLYIFIQHETNYTFITQFFDKPPQINRIYLNQTYQFIRYDRYFHVFYIFNEEYLYQLIDVKNNLFYKLDSLYNIKQLNFTLINKEYIITTQIMNQNNSSIIIKLNKLSSKIEISQIYLKLDDYVEQLEIIQFNNNQIVSIVQSRNNLIVYHYEFNIVNQFILIKTIIIDSYKIEKILKVQTYNNEVFIIEIIIENQSTEFLLLFNINYPSNYCLRIAQKKLTSQYTVDNNGNLVFIFEKYLQIIHHQQMVVQYENPLTYIKNYRLFTISNLKSPINRLINLSQILITIQFQNDELLVLNNVYRIPQKLNYPLRLQDQYVGLLSNITSEQFTITPPINFMYKQKLLGAQNAIYVKNNRIIFFDKMTKIIKILKYEIIDQNLSVTIKGQQLNSFLICIYYKKLQIDQTDYLIIICNDQLQIGTIQQTNIHIYQIILNQHHDDILFNKLNIVNDFNFYELNNCYINNNQLILIFKQNCIIYSFFINNNKLQFDIDTLRIDLKQQQIFQYKDQLFVSSIVSEDYQIQKLHNSQLITIFQQQLPFRNLNLYNIHLLYKEGSIVYLLKIQVGSIYVLYYQDNQLINKFYLKSIDNSSLLDFDFINPEMLILQFNSDENRRNIIAFYHINVFNYQINTDPIIYPLQIIGKSPISDQYLNFKHIQDSIYSIFSKNSNELHIVKIVSNYEIKLKNRNQQQGLIVLQPYIRNDSESYQIEVIIEKENIKYLILTIISIFIQAMFIQVKIRKDQKIVIINF